MAVFNLGKKRSQRFTDSISKNHINEHRFEKEQFNSKRNHENFSQKRIQVPQFFNERINPIISVADQKKESESNRKLIIFIACLALLVFTNPSLEMHQEKVKSYVVSSVEESISNAFGSEKETENGWVSLFTTLGINAFIPNMIKRENYIFFSFTILKKNDTSQTVGIGILGNVFLYREIEDYIYNQLPKW